MHDPNTPSGYLPQQPPPRVIPVQAVRPAGTGIGWKLFYVFLLIASLGLNALLCAGLVGTAGSAGSGDSSLYTTEKYHSGVSKAKDKVAIVKIDGALMEGTLAFAHKQIENAAGDKHVKAVVVRVESPGGTITASDDLYQRLIKLREGTTAKFADDAEKKFAKPMVISMGNVCASGGYYISMAAPQDLAKPGDKKLFAEGSTITGSIGVYASLPNVKELADKYGVKMNMIKAGDIKGAGSLFHELSPQERQPIQDMVDHSYNTFTGIVESGRPALKGKLTENLFADDKEIPNYDNRGNVAEGKAKYNRKRADGGIFTADDALKYGLIDAIGYVEDAAKEAARQATLSEYKVVQYEKPMNFLNILAGNASVRGGEFNALSKLSGPRVWVLMPGAELGAIAEAARGQ